MVVKKKKNWEAVVEMDDVFQAIMARECLSSQPLLNSQMRINYSEEKELLQKNDDEAEEIKDNSSAGTSSGGNSPISGGKATFDDLSPTFNMMAYPCFPSQQIINSYNQPYIVFDQCVPLNEMNNILIVNNLPENISPLMLFRLFGMYGNVMKVKILFNKPEKAFIEFQSPFQAEMARSNLNNCPLTGNNLVIDFAKKGTIVDVSLLKKEPNNKYMGDFTNSSEHRYKYVGSKNHSNIASPSKVLHLSNLPADRDEEFFRELFKETGRIDKFIFMKNTENMALVEMATIEEAIAILMFFHNFNVDGKYLKVSFSKYKKVK
jgi:hnRNP-L/PTB/hephaestus splicing factor